MKVRMTFDFDDRQRRAIALGAKRKKPASRVEVAQFVTELVTHRLGELERELARRDAAHDPNQLMLPCVENVA